MFWELGPSMRIFLTSPQVNLFYVHGKMKQKEKSEAPFVEFQVTESKGVILGTRWHSAFPAALESQQSLIYISHS